MAPVDEPVVAGLDRLEELVDEPALADARDADERDELRLALAQHAAERLAQERELLLAPDERRAADPLDAETRARARAPPRRRSARALPFASIALRLSVLDRALGRAERRLVDEDAVRRGRRLQPRRGVDDVARGDPLARLGSGAERDERLAGRDPDADLELAVRRERVADRERRAHGALGIVLVRDRRAEDGHHRVADELLDGAAEALELGAHARVVGLEEPPHVLGVHRLGARREADEVAEEAGDDLALLAGRASATSGVAHSEQNRASSAFS